MRKESAIKNMSDEEQAVGDGGETSGFGGIKVSSVEDIIAKARMAEAFLNVPKAGLSSDLSDLAELVGEGNNQETEGVEGENFYII